jgi:hypothetical protein
MVLAYREIPRFRQTPQYFERNVLRIVIASQEHLFPEGAHSRATRDSGAAKPVYEKAATDRIQSN